MLPISPCSHLKNCEVVFLKQNSKMVFRNYVKSIAYKVCFKKFQIHATQARSYLLFHLSQCIFSAYLFLSLHSDKHNKDSTVAYSKLLK